MILSHDWNSTYKVTYSFKTDVLTSRSGREQRRALRNEPRHFIRLALTLDTLQSTEFDRFTWTTGPAAFVYQGLTVRFDESQSVTHVTSGVSQGEVALSVEPGSETFAVPVIDAATSYQQRLVFPIRVNWRDSVGDSFALSRQTIDYGRGRINVRRPVPFSTRTTQVSTWVEDDSLLDFFRYNRGRQGDFWTVSALDDLVVLNASGTSITVKGDARPADGIEWGVYVELHYGGRYYRQVVGSALLGSGSTLLQLDSVIPDVVNESTVRRCSWVRLARFASDDLTIEWVTTALGQSQVQVQSLLPLPTDNPLGLNAEALAFIDFYGNGFPYDPLDYIVNVQLPRIGGDVTTRSWYYDGLEYIVNIQAPRIGVS